MVKDFSDSAAEDYGSNRKHFTPKSRKLAHKRDRDNDKNMLGVEDYNALWATEPVSIDLKNRSPGESEAIGIRKDSRVQKYANTTGNTEATLRDHS